MGRKQIFDHKLTNTEISRRYQDAHADITSRLLEARNKIDHKLKKSCEKDIVKWVKTYCVPILIDENPSKKGEQLLRQMYRAIAESKNTCLLVSRGFGKTCLTECVVVYALLTGKRKFPLIIGNNAKAAMNILNDLYRVFTEEGTAVSRDYPDVCLPFLIANGRFRRKMTYRGKDVEISKTQGEIHFPRIVEEDGTESVASGSCIATRGITGSMRGLKYHTLRVDSCVLDDIADDESAESPEQVEKTWQIILKSVMNLNGKGKLAVLACLTPITVDDLADRISKDKYWVTHKFPAVISWPKDFGKEGGLWDKYEKLYQEELTTDEPHDRSLLFYLDNKAAMDEGCEVISPNRFKKEDKEASAIQSLINKRMQIGEDNFNSEYQMVCKKYSLALDISPQIVLARTATFHRLTVPDGYTFTCAAIDLNTSYGATCIICAVKPDASIAVIYHNVFPMQVDQSLNDTLYSQDVYNKLSDIGRKLKSLGIPINALGVDAGGRNWNAVTSWCKNAFLICGIPACAMAGRSSTKINLYPRNKLRNCMGRTVLVGDEAEHIKAGSGQKWIYFDADWGKETFQRGFLSEVGAAGGCVLYSGTAQEHADFSIQCCKEKLKYKKLQSDNKTFYCWDTKEKHDYLDTGSMCVAIMALNSISAEEHMKIRTKVGLSKQQVARRRRIKFV